MSILIVSKTHMQNTACVGGLNLDNYQNVRLLQRNGAQQPENTQYQIGEIWDLRFRPRQNIKAPHVEDVLVDSGRKIGNQSNMRDFLLSKVQIWRGDPKQLFGGMIRFTQKGTGYISDENLPNCSVGFWIPSSNLSKKEPHGKTRYQYESQRINTRITYVGYGQTVDILPKGSLLRVSLARWWRPDNNPDIEKRCYLQLSGWYDITQSSDQKASDNGEMSIFDDDDLPF